MDHDSNFSSHTRWNKARYAAARKGHPEEGGPERAVPGYCAKLPQSTPGC